jgi:hypothetical protein
LLLLHCVVLSHAAFNLLSESIQTVISQPSIWHSSFAVYCIVITRWYDDTIYKQHAFCTTVLNTMAAVKHTLQVKKDA